MMQSELDKLILSYFDLLDCYVSLQNELATAASDAFVKLARARYLGTKIDHDSFKEAYDPHLTINSEALSQGQIKLQEQVHVAEAQANQVDKLEASLASTSLTASSGSEGKSTAEGWEATQPTKSDSANKPRLKRHVVRPVTDPLRNFGAMPAVALRQTQSTFATFVTKSLAVVEARRRLEEAERRIADAKASDAKQQTNEKEEQASETV